MKDVMTLERVEEVLVGGGIDFSMWGHGENKRLEDLWQEIEDGETVLEVEPLRRVVAFVQVIIREGERVLIEAGQEMVNGVVRERNRPLSEKMRLGEGVEAAALRGLEQELNLSREQIISLSAGLEVKTIVSPSPSYPGLITRYTIHTVEAVVNGLPVEDFSTGEASATDPVRRHYWRWVPEGELEEHKGT